MKTNIGWQDEVNYEKIRWINEYVDFSIKPKVLELGAGAGWYSKYLATRHCDITAIDQDPLFEDAKINLIIGDLEDILPFNDKEFDYIMAWDIIEHVFNDKQLLQEIKRVLKPNGKVLVSVPHADDSRIASRYLTYSHFKDKTHKREYTKEGLNKDFKYVGLTKIICQLHGGNGYPYVLLNFIDNKFFRFLMKIFIGVLKKIKVIQLKNCHGDIFGLYVKK